MEDLDRAIATLKTAKRIINMVQGEYMDLLNKYEILVATVEKLIKSGECPDELHESYNKVMELN